uniref:Phospholipase B-like n=1 Tax=Meloidogyne enterolobii TaxID=390850 RepID=A0A6V7UXR1_MELEN|nr:unnamed protein product [Meloidogyne enterolobii]
MLIKYYFIGIFILQIVTLINSERLPFWQRARDQILNKVQNTNLEDFKFNDLFDLSEEKQEILQEEKEGYDTDYTYKSICFIDGKPMVVNNLDFALGRFRNAINISGWSYLEIETKGEYDPGFQAYAAGYIEGVLTQRVLHLHIQNTVKDYCKGYQNYCKKLMIFLDENMQYVKRKIDTAAKDNPYWQAVKMAYMQLTGIWHGYSSSKFNPSIQYEAHFVMLLNSNGDFYDLESKLNKTKDPADDITGGRCSGLIKVAPNNADLFISQVTMSGFQNMLRMLKLYKFGVDSILYPGHTSTFAGYPGVIYSSDDFALTSTGLAVIETTVKVWNISLYEATKTQGQILCWVRAVVANLLSRTPREWCQIFKRYNSGTYNNQWGILDYKRFTPEKPLPDSGLFYVLEQMPGHVYYQDLSLYLKEKTYFASYNIPFFKKASRISGFKAKGNEFYWFNWTDCPRAKIFARDHNKVIDLDTLTKLMRYNDYKHDEFSRCKCSPPYTAEAAISSRGDLNEPNGTYPLPGMGHVNHGALDYKGTNYELAKQLRFRAWSGPTYGNVPVFDWRTSLLAPKVKHFGHPDRWDFKPVDYRWETQLN